MRVLKMINNGLCVSNTGGFHANFEVILFHMLVGAGLCKLTYQCGAQTCDATSSSHGWTILRTGHIQYDHAVNCSQCVSVGVQVAGGWKVSASRHTTLRALGTV